MPISHTEKEEADKTNVAFGPAISVALQQFALTEELQEMKLHSVLSSYRRAFSGKSKTSLKL